MQRHQNRRGYGYDVVEGRHLKLEDLKEEAAGLRNQYLVKGNIPAYPRPEFRVSRVKHDTHRSGLNGIRRDGGFRAHGPKRLLWWSLSVGADDVTAAETRLLEETFPDRTEEQARRQQSFLGTFATSPAFMETSRLGSYRFTFPLEEVLQAYSDQFCSRAQPIMRVFETHLYKQEVMYAVLVHSPANQELFSNLPLLTDHSDAVCAYEDGRFIWRPEAMCETHRYELIQRRDENLMEVNNVSRPQFYVWDNVAVALHVEGDQVLTFDAEQLRKNLTFCQKGRVTIMRDEKFETLEEAEDVVKQLWPDYPGPLREETPLRSASHVAEPDSSD